MTEFFSIFELRFHTAFEFGDSRQAEFSFLSFLMITQEISHIFCVYRRWNRQNCSILSISNLRLTFLRFSENPFIKFIYFQVKLSVKLVWLLLCPTIPCLLILNAMKTLIYKMLKNYVLTYIVHTYI